MSFEIRDWFQDYSKRGDGKGYHNVAYSDESETEGATRYYAYQNENGAYIIQKTATSGSLVIKVYTYYGRRDPLSLSTDWSNRASLTYTDYYQLFTQ